MATEARPGAVLGRASSPALRTLCVCSARTLHTPCTLRSRAEAASEREAHSFEKIDFDGRARAYVGCGGRLGTLSPNPLSAPRPCRYAIVWGDNHRTKTIEECAQRCLEWRPQPPSMYACNIFVFCPLEKCYAPAALPPGPMTGQCWLKHQPDPNKPQVNMKGCRSKSRPAQLPCSPEHSLGRGATSAAYCLMEELMIWRSPTTRKGDYSEAYIRRHPGAPSSVQWQAGVVVKKGSAVDTNVWSSRANW